MTEPPPARPIQADAPHVLSSGAGLRCGTGELPAAGLLAACGLTFRPADDWQGSELAMVAEGMADLLAAAHWTPAACRVALGGAITLIRDRNLPIVTDQAGTRYPVLGLYDARQRTLTINDWSFDPRTGGEEGGRRVLLHELAHAWDTRSRYLLSLWLRWLPGPRASGYAATSRFEDWADAVMATVYGPEPGCESFAHPRSLRLRYVRCAFRRYR